MTDFRAICRSIASSSRPFRNVSRYAIALPLLFLATGVQAEGSRDLISNGGYRPYLEYSNLSAGSVPRRTIIKVFVNPGETLELASSAVGIGDGVINYRRPDNTTGSCNAAGLISNRTAEVNRSYTPCTVAVAAGEGGIWQIDFVSPDEDAPLGTNPARRTVSQSWAQPSNAPYVSAWDVTVVDSFGSDVSGRVYANYYAFNMGDNNIALNSEFTVLTEEGYQYALDLNGLDPFGFILFANNSGYRGADGQPIFRSLQYVGSNPGSVPDGFSFQNPNNPDTAQDVTHKLFINLPDSSMPSSSNSPTGLTWLFNLPQAPPLPQNFQFIGVEGTNGQAGTSPLGGNFTFDSSDESSYSITLDINGDGIFGNSNDRSLLGRADIGNNAVLWDGLDGDGNAVAASDTGYGAQINFYAGEAHFPMVDAENNPNGIKLTRLNTPALATFPAPDPAEIFYDDRLGSSPGSDFSLCSSSESGGANGCYGTAPSPRSALTGVNSSSGAHRFSNSFGDIRGIDTWVFYPSNTVVLDSAIRIREADLVLLKTDNTITVDPGDSLTYVITIENTGPSNVVGATFRDNLPPQLTNVTWTCDITTGMGACGADSGAANSANQISTTVDLEKDAIATYTITTQVSSGTPSGSINNTGIVDRPNDVTDPNEANNEDDDTTTVNVFLDLTLVKRITAIDGTAITTYVDDTNGAKASNDNHPNWPTSSNDSGISDFLAGAINDEANPGEIVEYTVYFLSGGNAPLTNVNLCDWIPPNTTYIPNSAELFIDGSTTNDGVQFIPAISTVTVPCPSGSDANGVVVVNIVENPDQLPAATAPGTPTDAYGYIRFRVTVD